MTSPSKVQARENAIRYLSAPSRGLWRWTEQGKVVVWADDSTVAFRQEITQVLQTLAPRALPPFGAVIFLLAACRGRIPTLSQLDPDAEAHARAQLRAQLVSDLEQLGVVANLPAELRSPLRARCLLAEMAFEASPTVRHTDGADVLATLDDRTQPLTEADLANPFPIDLTGSQQRQIHLVASGLRSLTTDTLALRLRTGLDQLPDPASLDQPTADRARALIESLERDPNHRALARATRDLQAAIRLPRRLGPAEPTLSGGYADITHRGPLDRLLLSELAHDDLTLAVRIALNEALYVRREPEDATPTETLALLLDSGIRLWGIPRILAAAVALAFIANAPRHVTVHTWRARGHQLDPIDLLSRDGIIQHLATLDTQPHPGAAYAKFPEVLAPLPSPRPILITHADALLDPAFRSQLAEPSANPGLVATLDATGRFELHATPLTRRKPLCAAHLDVATLFSEPSRPPLKHRDAPADDLPIAFQVEPFPLLLPITASIEIWHRCPDDSFVALQANHTLVQVWGPDRGVRLLARNLPPQPGVWLEAHNGIFHLVTQATPKEPAMLNSIPVSGGTPRCLELFAGDPIRATHRCHDVLLILRTQEIRAYDLHSGRLVDRSIMPYRSVHGRYLIGEGRFQFMSWDGTRIRIETLVAAANGTESPIVCVFDRPGFEGPWVVRQDGTVGPLIPEPISKPPRRLEQTLDPDTPIWISHDGRRLASAVPAAFDSYLLLDLDAEGSARPGESEDVSAFLGIPSPLPRKTLAHDWQAIGRRPDGMALLSHEGSWHQIVLTPSHNVRLRPFPNDALSWPDAISGFIEVAPHPDLGCELAVASWPNGSRAFLDSRGLLHLKSHVPGNPEVSLVLDPLDEIAGWTSEGAVCGPPFYFESPSEPHPEAVFEACLQFLAHL